MSEPSQGRQEEDAVQLPAATASHEGDPLLPSAATIETTPDVRCHRVAMKQRGCLPVRWRPDWTQQGMVAMRCWYRCQQPTWTKQWSPPGQRVLRPKGDPCRGWPTDITGMSYR